MEKGVSGVIAADIGGEEALWGVGPFEVIEWGFCFSAEGVHAFIEELGGFFGDLLYLLYLFCWW